MPQWNLTTQSHGVQYLLKHLIKTTDQFQQFQTVTNLSLPEQ